MQSTLLGQGESCWLEPVTEKYHVTDLRGERTKEREREKGRERERERRNCGRRKMSIILYRFCACFTF